MAPQGFQDMLAFGLIEALLGRRSRRVFMGAEIPDGVFAFKSRPTTCAGGTTSDVAAAAIAVGRAASHDS
jgi:hypothetical protein